MIIKCFTCKKPLEVPSYFTSNIKYRCKECAAALEMDRKEAMKNAQHDMKVKTLFKLPKDDKEFVI